MVDPFAVDAFSPDPPVADGGPELALDGAAAGQSLSGTVVSWYTLGPLAGRKVVVGGQTATTDAAGRFTFPMSGSSYDAVVVEPGGAVISVFKGLSRRDPVLPHPGASAYTHTATVSGDLSGGGNYPLAVSDLVVVQFFSALSSQQWLLGGLSSLQQGPGFGPMALLWDGPAAITGELAAFGTFHAPDGTSTSWFTQRPLMLMDGQKPFVDLALTQIQHTGHISGRIDVPPGSSVLQKSILYRLPVGGATLAIPAAQSSAFDDEVPDLTETGAELCVASSASPGSVFTERCGIAVDEKDFDLVLDPSPAISSPAADAAIARDTPFAWTSSSNRIHLLQLETTPSSAATPRVFLFTADTSATFPDLGAAGVAFPAGTEYRCTVGGLGPYTSIDEALGPNGVGAPRPREIRRSFSPAINVRTVP